MTQAFYNLVVNGQRYVVQPVWSNQDNSCSMGGGSTPTNYQTGSSLNQFCSYCSSGGNTGLYSIPPSGQLGRLTSGSNWAAGSSTIFSSTNHNGLCMQTDGNICAKTNNLASQIWCSNTGGSNNGPFNLAMQPDGNLVAYDKNGNSLWASGTGGRSNDNYCTAMQADQNIVIYDSSCNVVWHLK